MSDATKTKESPRGIQITAPIVIPTDEQSYGVSLTAFEQDGHIRLAVIGGGEELFWVSAETFNSLAASGKTILDTLEDITVAKGAEK